VIRNIWYSPFGTVRLRKLVLGALVRAADVARVGRFALGCFATSPPIGDALPCRAGDGTLGAVRIIDAERDAGRIAEVEFGQAAVSVLLAAMPYTPTMPRLKIEK
jgi:hypothetical protein